MLDDVLASRIDNQSWGPGDGDNNGNRDSTEERDHEAKVIDIVKRLVEFNGLDPC